jgi:hypothetical protein
MVYLVGSQNKRLGNREEKQPQGQGKRGRKGETTSLEHTQGKSKWEATEHAG